MNYMPKKTGTGVGSLFFDKGKNRWVVQRYVINYETGKSTRKTKSFSSKEEGQKYLNTLMYQKENPLYIKNNGIPINELMRVNLQKKLDINLIKDRQFTRVLKTIEVIEKSYIAHKSIEEINAEELQGYFNTLKDYSNSYIKKIYEQYSQAFKYAVDKGYIVKNPIVDVIKPKSNKQDKVVRALEIEEQQQLTDFLINKTLKESPYKNAFLIQMYMGLRIGEVLALRNSDIDLKHNILRVEKTLTTDKNEKVIMGDKTKTYAGVRDLPIPIFIQPFIMEQMREGRNNNHEQLFLSTNGNLVDPRNANIALKKILKDNFNITGITTHSLRHSYGTRCIEAGMRAVALQRLMGHTDISITLNTYTSVFNRYKQSEIDKVNDYYLNNSLLPSELMYLPINEKDNKEIER